MNDFSDIEEKLRQMRAVSPRPDAIARLEAAMRQGSIETDRRDNVITPMQFRRRWAIGLGLAAAALILLALRLKFDPVEKLPPMAALSPRPVPPSSRSETALRDEFVPAGATEVVYRTTDEGLIFPRTSEPPVRRFRSRTRETLQWHNRATGASLRVSYPSEEVKLVPVAGQ